MSRRKQRLAFYNLWPKKQKVQNTQFQDFMEKSIHSINIFAYWQITWQIVAFDD